MSYIRYSSAQRAYSRANPRASVRQVRSYGKTSSPRSSGWRSSSSGSSSRSKPSVPSVNWNKLNVGQIRASGYKNLSAWKAAVKKGQAAAPGSKTGKRFSISGTGPVGNRSKINVTPPSRIKNERTGKVEWSSKKGQRFDTQAEAVAANIRIANPKAFNPNMATYYTDVGQKTREAYLGARGELQKQDDVMYSNIANMKAEDLPIYYREDIRKEVPVYGEILDQVKFESRKDDIISSVYNKIFNLEQDRINKYQQDKQIKALKKAKLVGSVSGPKILQRKKKNEFVEITQEEVDRANKRIENLRKSLYGEADPNILNKKFVSKALEDIKKAKKKSTSRGITGYRTETSKRNVKTGYTRKDFLA